MFNRKAERFPNNRWFTLDKHRTAVEENIALQKPQKSKEAKVNLLVASLCNSFTWFLPPVYKTKTAWWPRAACRQPKAWASLSLHLDGRPSQARLHWDRRCRRRASGPDRKHVIQKGSIIVYTYIHVHPYIYIYIYIPTHIHMYVRIHIYICACMHTYTHISINKYIYIYMLHSGYIFDMHVFGSRDVSVAVIQEYIRLHQLMALTWSPPMK